MQFSTQPSRPFKYKYEPISKAVEISVYFLVGNRVKNYLANGYSREKNLTTLLNGGPEDHQTLVEKAVRNAKKYQKTTQNLLKELAMIKSAEIKASEKKYFSIHRPETDMDYGTFHLRILTTTHLLLEFSCEWEFFTKQPKKIWE